jgi:uncharacterized RDD family membrane protein YckC
MRYAARLIDGAIITVVLSFSYQLAYTSFAYYSQFINTKSDSLLSNYEIVGKYAFRYIIIFSIIFSWMYYAAFEASHWKGTPGKKLLGLSVTDSEGNRIGFGQATGRHFAKIISGLILGIGFLMAGFSEKKQALHDQIANCLVWKK